MASCADSGTPLSKYRQHGSGLYLGLVGRAAWQGEDFGELSRVAPAEPPYRDWRVEWLPPSHVFAAPYLNSGLLEFRQALCSSKGG
jgi:hypothetical protein